MSTRYADGPRYSRTRIWHLLYIACSTDGGNTLSELKALSKIIQDSVNSIETALASNNLEFPSPYTPFTLESEAARQQPDVARASALIVSASYQLINFVRSPTLTVVTAAFQVFRKTLSISLPLTTFLYSMLSLPLLASQLPRMLPRL